MPSQSDFPDGIPVILKFIADQNNANRSKGSPRVTTIWGYEEPENNLEMTKVFELATEFLDYSASIQILITTHSPGFYQLRKKFPDRINLLKVVKPIDKEAVVEPVNDGTSTLDGEMGILPLIAPIIEEKTSQIIELQNQTIALNSELDEHKKNVLFVEGKSDKIILEKALELLGMNDRIVIKSGGGCSWVKDQCLAYLYLDTPYKAVGLFDRDGAGGRAYSELVNNSEYKVLTSKRNIRGMKLEPPQHIINIYGKDVAIPVELEEMFPLKYFQNLTESWLEPRANLIELVRLDDNDTTVNQVLNTKGLTEQEVLVVTKSIHENKKIDFARKMAGKTGADLTEAFEPLNTFLRNKVLPFLS